MTVATHQRMHLSESLQRLIDSRLDTIDRMLLGRVARGERMAIVRDVESQVHELLGEHETDDLTRDDVLAVLARLDPPEAFLPEDFEGDQRAPVKTPASNPARSLHLGHQRVAHASGMLGLGALCSIVVLLLTGVVAEAFGLAILFYSIGTVSGVSVFICSPLGLALGIYSRKSGVWAFVGIVTSILALLLAVVVVTGIFLFA